MRVFKDFSHTLVLLLFITVIPAVHAQAPVRRSDSDLNERLDRIEQLLQSRGLLDMLRQLENLQQEITQLRGEIEVQNRNIEDLKRRQRALYTDIDQRLQGMQGDVSGNAAVSRPEVAVNPPLQTLSTEYNSAGETAVTQSGESPLNIEILPNTETRQQPDRVPGPGAGTQDQPGAVTMVQPETAAVEIDPVQAQTDYQQAFNLLKQSQYEMAIQSFKTFLSKYPVSDYSDNAQYWLGEAYYVMRQFELALQEYNKLIKNFPQSQKYTHALLKIGYSYHELGMLDEAKKYLQVLTQQYPGTTASRLAEERLKSIALTEQQAATRE